MYSTIQENEKISLPYSEVIESVEDIEEQLNDVTTMMIVLSQAMLQRETEHGLATEQSQMLDFIADYVSQVKDKVGDHKREIALFYSTKSALSALSASSLSH